VPALSAHCCTDPPPSTVTASQSIAIEVLQAPGSVPQDAGGAALPNLFGYDREGLRALFERLGEKPWRADQVMKWMYHRHVTDFDAMTDLGKPLREKLRAAVAIMPPKVLFEKQSTDGTH